MGFQDDWMMRQIEMMTQFVANVVFGKKESEITYEVIGEIGDSTSLTPLDQLHLQLCRMIREGDICGAEDILYDNMEYSNDYIRLASDFYMRLNKLSDEELDAGDFSRDEVYEGYIDMMSRLGVPVDIFGSADKSDYFVKAIPHKDSATDAPSVF